MKQAVKGERFGILTVTGNSKRVGKKGYIAWECVCDCGTKKYILKSNLRAGYSESCGCVRKINVGKINRTHGQSGTRLYRIWKAMHQRCNNENSPAYKYYGGRGIKINSGWSNDFMNFKRWADKNGYSDNLSIDRIDPNKNYEASNCRWATDEKQQNNKRNSFFLIVNENKLTVAEVAKENNIKKGVLYSRLYRLIESINIPQGKHIEIKIDYK